MAEPDATTAKATVAEIVDEARSQATETRTVAKWVASALAGIPTLALVTTLVRAPGDAGFDPGLLLAGIALGAFAAVLGIFAIADVLGPLALGDDDLRGTDISKVPGHDIGSADELIDDIETLSNNAGKAERRALFTQAQSEKARIMAEAVGNDAKAFEVRAAAAKPPDDKLDAEAKARRAQADLALLRAADLSSRSVHAVNSLKADREQIAKRQRIRSDALALLAGERVAVTFRKARRDLALAATLAALSVFSLAMAPKAKPAESATEPPALVNLELEQAGRDLLGCDAEEVQALQVGGTTEQPKVITLPSTECRSVYVDFQDQENQSLGNVTKPELLTPAPAPVPSD